MADPFPATVCRERWPSGKAPIGRSGAPRPATRYYQTGDVFVWQVVLFFVTDWGQQFTPGPALAASTQLRVLEPHMTYRIDWTLRLILLTIALSLAVIAVSQFIYPSRAVLAQPARFDHVAIISPTFLYNGAQGLLLMDKRNGKIWFMPKGNSPSSPPFSSDPTYILRIPFEKLDQPTQ
jgi:hypothetical protein